MPGHMRSQTTLMKPLGALPANTPAVSPSSQLRSKRRSMVWKTLSSLLQSRACPLGVGNLEIAVRLVWAYSDA